MEDFKYKTVCILGRQPAIGVAELERLYGPDGLARIDSAALLEIPAEEINFKRLGGTVKVARILSILPSDWVQILNYLIENVPKHLEYAEPGKFTLGVSLYGIKLASKQLNQDVLKLKKVIKATGRPVRIVPNKNLELNSAQVLHNKLTHRGSWELVLVKNGNQTILAQTIFVQDIEAYAARDQARPKRDSRVGMLPPKLAQTLINLAQPKQTVLDPFCGTGVVLQEALLMGYNAYGTDLESRMIDFSKANLDWLKLQQPKIEDLKVELEAADATKNKWSGDFDSVASEVFLGRPLAKLPDNNTLKAVINDANTITKKFLANIAPQLNSGLSLALAVPAWKNPSGGFYHLPVIDQLTDLGYNRVDLKTVRQNELIYHREGQTVARELLILIKK